MSESKRGSNLRWHRLLLEIIAIFIGITASFLVDDWREERQDTETFHRILGEIYYDIIRDESLLVETATFNNRSLQAAGALAVSDDGAPAGLRDEEAAQLFETLSYVFFFPTRSMTVGGYSRLSNTALAVAVNDIQLTLDNLYQLLDNADENLRRLQAELDELGARHLRARGGVSCRDLGSGLLNEADRAALDLPGMLEAAGRATRRGDVCLTSEINARIAREALSDETFHTALREAIEIRQQIATQLAFQRGLAASIRWSLEEYLPDITLPIESIGLIGSATPAEWEPTEALPMTRLGPNDWVLETTLMDGEVKFLANFAWTMNWGAQRPWVARAGTFAPRQVALEEAFPAGKAWFTGLNIPVRAGHYRVRFNTQSGEYSFESLEAQ